MVDVLIFQTSDNKEIEESLIAKFKLYETRISRKRERKEKEGGRDR